MKRSDIRRSPFRKLVVVLALLYGVAVGLLVVPRVVGTVVPTAVRTAQNHAYSTRVRDSQSDGLCPCHLVSEGRRVVARLWNQFQ